MALRAQWRLDLIQDVFHGYLEINDGYAWINERPGSGVEIDEAFATKHPITGERPNEVRTSDGSVIAGTG